MLDMVKVTGSSEFRDAVVSRVMENKHVYVRKADTPSPVYRVVSGDGLRHLITVGDLFDNHYAPVNMEVFATALSIAKSRGEEPIMEVFTL